MKPRKTEHPILFSTPMVQAILEGRKTMTRRIVNMEYLNKEPYEWSVKHIDEMLFTFSNKGCAQSVDIRNPYGQPGDKLWVRETWCKSAREWFFYKAGGSDIKLELLKEEGFKWKPSIHMPKAAARIWLMITDVRVERLQDISEEDAKAEGIEKITLSNEVYKCYQCDKGHLGINNLCEDGFFDSANKSFESLWKKINGAESWNSNPWVWVIEFKRIEPCQ